MGTCVGGGVGGGLPEVGVGCLVPSLAGLSVGNEDPPV